MKRLGTKPPSKRQAQNRKNDIPQNIVDSLAYMLLVEDRPYEDCASVFVEQGITVEKVKALRQTRICRDKWIDAIVKLANKGLLV